MKQGKLYSTIIFVFLGSTVLSATDCLGTFQSSWNNQDQAYALALEDCESNYSNSISQMLCKSEEYVQNIQAQDQIIQEYDDCTGG